MPPKGKLERRIEGMLLDIFRDIIGDQVANRLARDDILPDECGRNRKESCGDEG